MSDLQQLAYRANALIRLGHEYGLYPEVNQELAEFETIVLGAVMYDALCECRKDQPFAHIPSLNHPWEFWA